MCHLMKQADIKSLMDRQTADDDAIPTCQPTYTSNKPSFVVPEDVHIPRLVPSPQHCLYLLLSTHRHLVKLVEVSTICSKLLTVVNLESPFLLNELFSRYM